MKIQNMATTHGKINFDYESLFLLRLVPIVISQHISMHPFINELSRDTWLFYQSAEEYKLIINSLSTFLKKGDCQTFRIGALKPLWAMRRYRELLAHAYSGYQSINFHPAGSPSQVNEWFMSSELFIGERVNTHARAACL